MVAPPNTANQQGGYHLGPPAPGASVKPQGDIALRKLFVRGLNYDTPSEVLQEVFGQYGQVG